MTDERLREENRRLRDQVRDLQARVHEPEDTIRAIREGEVDAFVVTAPDGERIYSLRTADALYRAMVEEMKEGALAVDTTGMVLYVNPHFGRMVGIEPARAIGLSIHAFVAEESHSAFDRMREKTERGIHTELSLIGSDGERIPVLATLNLIRLDDAEVFGMIVTDLREQLSRQEMLAESNRKDEFLAMLAHELRNPLAPIRNALGLMSSPGLSKPSFDWSRQVIDRQLNQLVRLLDDLLDVQRFTHGMIELKKETVELGELIERALEGLHASAAEKSQVLRVERASEAMPVEADPARLTQILSNLFVNAVKYSPPGSEISVSWRRVGEHAHIRVADNGMGMSPDLLKRVFDPFVQGDRDLSRSQGGLGLGLTLVKRLVELHGGSVKATSPGLGAGSEFIVILPLQLGQHRPPSKPPPLPRHETRPAQRVLVVDDNEDSAVSLCALLKHAGHQTSMALDGTHALEAAVEFHPDVIVLDIGLPGMDGYELAKKFREMGSLADCRLVALTGYGRSQDRDRTSAAGFSVHLVKPVDLQALIEAIEPSAATG